MSLLSNHSKEIAIISYRHQNHVSEPMPPCGISRSMICATRFRSPPKPSQRYIIKTPEQTRAQQRDPLCNTSKEKKCALMNYGTRDIITGHHLRDDIEMHKLEIRCARPLFTNNLPALSHCITLSWISLTCKYIRDTNMSL